MNQDISIMKEPTRFEVVSVPFSVENLPVELTAPVPDMLNSITVDIEISSDGSSHLVILYSAREEDMRQDIWMQKTFYIVKHPCSINLPCLVKFLSNFKLPNGDRVSVLWRSGQKVPNPHISITK